MPHQRASRQARRPQSHSGGRRRTAQASARQPTRTLVKGALPPVRLRRRTLGSGPAQPLDILKLAAAPPLQRVTWASAEPPTAPVPRGRRYARRQRRQRRRYWRFTLSWYLLPSCQARWPCRPCRSIVASLRMFQIGRLLSTRLRLRRTPLPGGQTTASTPFLQVLWAIPRIARPHASSLCDANARTGKPVFVATCASGRGLPSVCVPPPTSWLCLRCPTTRLAALMEAMEWRQRQPTSHGMAAAAMPTSRKPRRLG